MAPAWRRWPQSPGASGARDCRGPTHSVARVVTDPTQGWRPQGKGADLAWCSAPPSDSEGAGVWGRRPHACLALRPDGLASVNAWAGHSSAFAEVDERKRQLSVYSLPPDFTRRL